MRFSISACKVPHTRQPHGTFVFKKTTIFFTIRVSIQLGEVYLFTYLLGGVLDQTFRVAFPPRGRLRADVDEVPGVVVVFAEDVVFGVVQQGQELVEEALLALLGELPVEADHAAPEHGAEVVHVFVRGHPVSSRGLGLVKLFFPWLLTEA